MGHVRASSWALWVPKWVRPGGKRLYGVLSSVWRVGCPLRTKPAEKKKSPWMRFTARVRFVVGLLGFHEAKMGAKHWSRVSIWEAKMGAI